MYKTARNVTMLGLGLSLSAVVGWLLLKETRRQKALGNASIRSQPYSPETDALPQIVLPLDALKNDEAIEAHEEQPRDDLTQINGIGPRFAEALYAIGITRFADLASQTPDILAQRLAQHTSVSSQRIQDKNWIGQAAQLAQR
jgi:predicted flap endonuclease-1-like 5' DNA nuclease